MAIEMMSISHCYCSDYMTKPTQFGDEPKKGNDLLKLGDTAPCFCLKLLFGFTLRGESVNEEEGHG